jgi:hypothetical protein
MILISINPEITFLQSMVPGGGVEPPRAEARRILSPLRLPVPPSRPTFVCFSSLVYAVGFVIRATLELYCASSIGFKEPDIRGQHAGTISAKIIRLGQCSHESLS